MLPCERFTLSCQPTVGTLPRDLRCHCADSMVPDSDLALFAALGNEDPAEESFEQLFERMRLMKGEYDTQTQQPFTGTQTNSNCEKRLARCWSRSSRTTFTFGFTREGLLLKKCHTWTDCDIFVALFQSAPSPFHPNNGSSMPRRFVPKLMSVCQSFGFHQTCVVAILLAESA